MIGPMLICMGPDCDLACSIVVPSALANSLYIAQLCSQMGSIGANPVALAVPLTAYVTPLALNVTTLAQEGVRSGRGQNPTLRTSPGAV